MPVYLRRLCSHRSGGFAQPHSTLLIQREPPYTSKSTRLPPLRPLSRPLNHSQTPIALRPAGRTCSTLTNVGTGVNASPSASGAAAMYRAFVGLCTIPLPMGMEEKPSRASVGILEAGGEVGSSSWTSVCDEVDVSADVEVDDVGRASRVQSGSLGASVHDRACVRRRGEL